MSKQQKINLRVEKGMFIPLGRADIEALRERNYKIGDIVQAIITKPRNPSFNRLVHRIGWLCISMIPAFHNYHSAHQVLKRLQLEANIGCDHIKVNKDGEEHIYSIPQSLSFENLDEHEFKEISRGFCRHIAERYWPDMSADDVEEMAESFVEE